MNTKLGTGEKTDFKKDLFKLMNNAVRSIREKQS